MKRRTVWLAIAALLASQAAVAQSFFLPASDGRLRDDISLLVDEGVADLPLNEWPLAREDVARAIAKVNAANINDAALRSALARVVAATSVVEDAADWRIREIRVTAGEPGLLRDYSTLGRENAELRTMGGMSNERYGITLAATGVVDPSDGQEIRLDGSDLTIRWGNWLFSANQLERWWGPGHEGSLILSTNARPLPALSVDRYRSLPMDVPLLRWLGPWRFSGFLGLGENHRPDVDRPLYAGMRLTFKPAPIFEFSLSRTAQFCGDGRRCSVETFGRMLIGQDNVYMRGLNDPRDEPGNQMAGFDVRLVSPFKALPVALYAQEIGEDNSSSGIPERYLGLFGAETWVMLDSGSVVRAHVEYANTSVKWYNAGVEPDWAYRQGTFFAGYRHRSRNIGHATDADSETTSVVLSLTRPDGERWGVLYRHGRLDSYGNPDIYNGVTLGPSDYDAVQLSWDGKLLDQAVGAQLGYEKQSPSSAGNARGAFGFIQWRRAL